MAWRREYMPEITDDRVWDALNSIPRRRFLGEAYQDDEFLDAPLPIGFGQTISQPSLVAYMTQLLMLEGHEKVLEIGTGSGYQTAFLARLAKEVYTVEVIKPLQERAKEILKSLGYTNIHYKIGNGFDGWEEHAPYDAIMVTCAPERVPKALIDQLAEGGRMVIPVGPEHSVQMLYRITKVDGRLNKEPICHVRFVPMIEKQP
ncbi:MAG: protein-L-isoaspartate(D-aspartate) O-methyltransferase [Caldicoprobacter oshimai]|uniref:Protein-L-isoaspartate O-methyltransferase n=1 Tax=Caldicoprobacter faecalis TaxID=937334 RepID=A0A1I5XQP5_9FIRM|nr:protein-L-isoaspartate(D-aspartate) O-methyltransferase [Caldicoprobacter faecalis]PZN10192.1 MAG: protein-L-isoaspartate(D-aspartate) O-methyltransferase [Caldicoprobacter oshimai]SFQ34301.1 protein-L-isoaspartate(D-aspartate) O-methyltransferase [Caldicoprobacter faecalis]